MSTPIEPELPSPSADSLAKATSELNNLLQIISGTSSLIGNAEQAGSSSAEYLAMLRACIERTEKLAAQLGEHAGGTDEKRRMRPELAGFVRARKKSSSATVKHSILVVDDEPMALTLMERVLGDAGFHVVTAQSGFECVDIFRQQPFRFDAVLLDLSLPFMDGEETFARLRDLRAEIPVVLCTGFIEEERLNRLMASGLTGFLRKPIAPDEVVSVVRSILESVKYTSRNWNADGMSAVV
jgi:CheY-like chemotaxis protein